MKNRSFLIISIILSSIILSSNIAFASNVLIQADKQNYNGNSMNFEGNVNVGIDDITVKSPKAFMKVGNDGKPQIATFVNGAIAVKDNGISKSEVKAKIIRLSLLDNYIKAEGDAKFIMMENKKPVVTINSNTQEFDMTNNLITATGNVNIDYNEVATKSSQAKIYLENGKPAKVDLIGFVKVVQGKNIINANNVIFNPVTNELIAQGNTQSQTLLDDNTKVLIWSENQHYDKATNTLITSGQVKIDYMDYIATGPKATFLPGEKSSKPNIIVFLGRSKIQEGARQVEADKIEITINPKNFIAEGNVKTKFTQIKKDDKTKNSDQKKKKKTAKVSGSDVLSNNQDTLNKQEEETINVSEIKMQDQVESEE